MKFNLYLQDAHSNSGMSREDFAEFIGVSRPTLNSYLSGDTCPDICKACEIIKKTGKRLVIVEEVCSETEN